MTDNTRALLEQALEALDSGCFIPPASSWHKAIRAELAKPTVGPPNQYHNQARNHHEH